ncbi:MAG: bidirectional hydrogenase complex protein HoxE, partial [Phormidesmis sp.]
RWRLLEATMKRYQYRSDALIEVLHKAQELFGYLSPELLQSVARALEIPLSQVYGVATFYHFFSLAPKGQHSCTVCLGTACYVKGATQLLSALEQHLGIRSGQTTANGEISLSTARCLGACGIAPVAVVDDAIAGHQTPELVIHRIEEQLSCESD